MTIESAVYLNTLNSTLPSAGDAKSEGDDHLRLLKTVLKSTFPNVTGAVNPTQTEFNTLVGITGAVVGTTNAQTLTNKSLTSPTITGTGTAAFSTISGALTGSATSLSPGRNINGILFDGTGNITVAAAAGTLTGSALAAGVTASSLTSVASGCTDGTNELGYKGLPSASVTTGAFAATDRGKCVYATGSVTVPNATMGDGDVVVLQETTGSAQAVTAAIATLRQTGTTNTGSRTLKAYGRASIVFRGAASVLAFISGDVT